MFWNRKKATNFEKNYPELSENDDGDNEDDSDTNDADADNNGIEGHDTSDSPLHAMGDGDGVPAALKEKLAEIRGSQDSGYIDVEVDEDGNALNEEDAALLKKDAAGKDADVSGGDAVNQGSEEGGKSEAEAGDDSSEDYEQVELDPRLEAAGKALGWSDDKIALVAETDMTILEDIATRLDSSDTHRQDKDGKVKDGDTNEQGGLVDEEALAKLKEKLGDGGQEVLDALMGTLEGKFAAKFKEVDDLKAHREQDANEREAIQRGSIADEVFDKHAEQFKEFGITKDLPKDKSTGQVVLNSPQMNVRAGIYKVAIMFHQTNGGTFEKAMKDAVQYYAGGQRTTEATRRVVKDLKSNKKRFTPKPTGRKTVRVFKNTDAKAVHIVQEAKRKAGIKSG